MMLRSLLFLFCVYQSALVYAGSGFTKVASIPLGEIGVSRALALDRAGNLYVAGLTSTTNIPGQVFRYGPGGYNDATIRKLDPNGNALFTIVIGGSSWEEVGDIALDDDGSIYVVGTTYSSNFPTKGAIQTSLKGVGEGFICKISADGANLNYSTYLGGTGEDDLARLVVMANGEVTVCGSTSSKDFPVTGNAAQKTASLGIDFTRLSDAVVVRLNPNGSALIYSTYLGGVASDIAKSISVDPYGDTWIAGETGSPDFPVTFDAAQPRLAEPEGALAMSSDIFLTKFTPTGIMSYSTYWDAGASETLGGFTLDSAGNIYFGGSTGPKRAAGVGVQFPPVPQGNSYSFYTPELPYISGEAFVARLSAYPGGFTDYVKKFGSDYAQIPSLFPSADGGLSIGGLFPSASFIAELDVAGSNFVRFQGLGECGFYPGGGNLFAVKSNNFYVIVPESSPTSIFLNNTRLDVWSRTNGPESGGFPPLIGSVHYGIPLNTTVGEQVVPITAVDIDGTVRAVALYNGSSRIGIDTNAPYQITLRKAAPGTYHLKAVAYDDSGLSVTSCPVTYVVYSPPPNDDFASRTRVVGNSWMVQGTTAGASVELEETSAGLRSPRRTIWWCWTATTSDFFGLSISDNTASVTVFEGAQLNNLKRITSLDGATTINGQSPNGTDRRTVFRASAGTTYHIRAGSLEETNLTLALRPVTPPLNDNRTNSYALSGATLSILGSNINATAENLDYYSSFTPVATVWWNWTAPSSGIFLVALEPLNGARLNLDVKAATGSPFSIVQSGSLTEIRATNGQRFDIEVGGIGGDMGQFKLSINRALPPPNDAFAQARVLAGLPVTTEGALLGATREAGETNEAQASVWYSWTAPTNTQVVLQGSAVSEAAVRVYTGSQLATLTLVANDASGKLQFHVTQGTRYFIAVDKNYNLLTNFFLTLRAIDYSDLPPVNDYFANRLPLYGASPEAIGTDANATAEAGEIPTSSGSPLGSVWYSWVAPTDGKYTLGLTSYDYSYFTVVIFTGSSITSLAPLTSTNLSYSYSSALSFSALQGVQYQIRVSQAFFGPGIFRLKIRPSAPPANDNFSNRVATMGERVLMKGTTFDATTETGEPTHGVSVWYSWRPARTQAYVIMASGGPSAMVYTGEAINALTRINSAFCCGNAALIHAVVGTEYKIAVTRDETTSLSDFYLVIDPVSAPSNDNFNRAIELYGTAVSTSGSTLAASLEQGEGYPGESVWWWWRALEDGRVTVRLSDFRDLRVFTGNTLTSLQVISSAPDDTNAASFTAIKGTTYRIRVAEQRFSPFTLTLQKEPIDPEASLLTIPEVGASGGFEFYLMNAHGALYILERSTNLQHWIPVVTNRIDCSPFPYILPRSSAPGHQFYRTRRKDEG